MVNIFRYIKEYLKDRKRTKRIIEEDNCPICLDRLKNKKKKDLGQLRCGHIFCRDCIKKSLKYNPRCPLCQGIFNLIDKDGHVTDFLYLYEV
jgi:hypothetical protein